MKVESPSEASSKSIESIVSPASSFHTSFAQTMQCTGRSGVLRIVQTG